MNTKQASLFDRPIQAPRPPLPDYMIRVVSEKQDLDLRIGRLAVFIDSPGFKNVPEFEQKLLRQQRQKMVELSEILGLRLAAY